MLWSITLRRLLFYQLHCLVTCKPFPSYTSIFDSFKSLIYWNLIIDPPFLITILILDMTHLDVKVIILFKHPFAPGSIPNKLRACILFFVIKLCKFLYSIILECLIDELSIVVEECVYLWVEHIINEVHTLKNIEEIVLLLVDINWLKLYSIFKYLW